MNTIRYATLLVLVVLATSAKGKGTSILVDAYGCATSYVCETDRFQEVWNQTRENAQNLTRWALEELRIQGLWLLEKAKENDTNFGSSPIKFLLLLQLLTLFRLARTNKKLAALQTDVTYLTRNVTVGQKFQQQDAQYFSMLSAAPYRDQPLKPRKISKVYVSDSVKESKPE